MSWRLVGGMEGEGGVIEGEDSGGWGLPEERDGGGEVAGTVKGRIRRDRKERVKVCGERVCVHGYLVVRSMRRVINSGLK